MPAFYDCYYCGKEFLGYDNIPLYKGKHVRPICEKCQPSFDFCIVCEGYFDPSETDDKSKEICSTCWDESEGM